MKILKWALRIVFGLLLVAAIQLYYENTKPKIEIGLVEGHFKEIPNKDNSVSTQTAYEDKQIEALEMKDNLTDTMNALKEAIDAYGNIRIIAEEEAYLYAVATTGLMKFNDDIEIYVDEAEGLVHYRSASRAGYGDMGLNRQRYEVIAASYKAMK